MASPTPWTWVWVDSRSWGWTGRPGVMWFMGSHGLETCRTYSGGSPRSQSGAPVKNPWAVVPSGFLRRSHLATDEHRGCCGAGLLGTVVLWDQYRPGPSPRFSSASGAVFILPGTGGVRARAGVGLALCWSLPWARNPDHPSASMSCCPWSRCPGPVAGSSAH